MLSLHGEAFTWDAAIVTVVSDARATWGHDLCYDVLCNQNNASSLATRWEPMAAGPAEATLPASPEIHDDGPVILWLGDDFQFKEGTLPHPARCKDQGLHVKLGWNLQEVRDFPLSRACAIFLCVLGTWEATGVPRWCLGASSGSYS